MKYAFVRLVDNVGKSVYMDPWSYDRYSNVPVFKNSAKELVIFDNIYIACFPLMFRLADIFEYNDSAKLCSRIPLTDIVFMHNTTNEVAKMRGCDN